MSSSTDEKIRVSFAQNHNHKDERPAVVPNDFKKMLEAASNRLRIKAKRLFTPDGDEITLNNFNSFQFKDGSKIIVSTGTDFAARKKDEQSKKKELVVGLDESFDSQTDAKECPVRLISKESLVEDGAVDQMHATAKLPRMRLVVGLPDVHPGKGFPIGSASVSEDVFYPHLVGGDIGCGMTLYQTSFLESKAKIDIWTECLKGLETSWPGDSKAWLNSRGVVPTDHDSHTLGTIGGGNHFAELQKVEEIINEEEWNRLGLDSNRLFLLVHSGSRSYGDSILRSHLDQFGPKGLLEDSEEGRNYMEAHNNALKWAKANRALIAHRFLSCLSTEPISSSSISCQDQVHDPTPDGSTRKLDIWHNFVCRKGFADLESIKLPSSSSSTSQPSSSTETAHSPNDTSNSTSSEKSTLNGGIRVGNSMWLHRKGAAPSDSGPVVIPGSRGHYSYLVLPSSNNSDLEHAAYSLAHGAGRKWNRSKALQSGKKLMSASKSVENHFGNQVICEEKDLFYEEIPEAYKDIEAIIDDLKSFKLISVIAIMRPLITYKTRVTNHSK